MLSVGVEPQSQARLSLSRERLATSTTTAMLQAFAGRVFQKSDHGVQLHPPLWHSL